MLPLLTFLTFVATAAEIEVFGTSVQIVRVDGQRVMPSPGTASVSKRRLAAGPHSVIIETALGKELASLDVELAGEEGIRLRYSKKTLVEQNRYMISAPAVKAATVDPDKAPPDPNAVTISKKGMLHNYVWLDGSAQGRVKNRKGLSLAVGEGSHELWVANDEDGTWTHCHGLVQQGSQVALSMKGCEGLTPGRGESGSFFRGATSTFRQGPGIKGWVSIDAGAAYAPGGGQRELNLAPGSHTFTLSANSMGSPVYAQGSFSVQANMAHAISCTTAGCVGLDQPPVPFTPVAAQQSQSSTSGDSSSSGSAGGNFSCCVNGAFYECPSAGEVHDCTGAFMACMMNCDMMDPSCMDTCERDHPIDPSGCDRASSRDGECD